MLVWDAEVMKGPDEVEGGWTNPQAMILATAVVMDLDTRNFETYINGDLITHPEGAIETGVMPNARNELFDRLRAEDIISFNGIRFDNGLLMTFADQLEQAKFSKYWTDIDLLLRVCRSKFGKEFATIDEAEALVGVETIHNGSLSLDALCRATFGRGKTGKGAEVPQMLREGRLAEVLAYNANDVTLTAELFTHGLQYGYVLDGEGNRIKALW